MSYSDLTKGSVSLDKHAYLITTVCHHRQPLFLDLMCVRNVINEMKQIQQQGVVQSFAFVLMLEHLHWPFCLQQQELSWVINQFKGRTARILNAQSSTTGTIWQRGFHDHAIREKDEIKPIARYIVANPLHAGIVENIADYPQWDAIWLNNTLAR